MSGYSEVQAKLKVIERNGGAVAAGAEMARFEAEVAKLRTELEAARLRADSSLQVLGRACLAARFHPPGVEAAIAEAERLQANREE